MLAVKRREAAGSKKKEKEGEGERERATDTANGREKKRKKEKAEAGGARGADGEARDGSSREGFLIWCRGKNRHSV